MTTRQANIMMVCATIGLSHVILVAAYIVPRFMMDAYRLRSVAELDAVMPTLTKFAVNHAWIFPTMLVAICSLVVVFMRRRKDLVDGLAIGGLCIQCLVAWLAAFCFCFESFTGSMCLLQGPNFEFPQFLTIAWGIFPITFLALLVPLTGAARELINNRKSNKASEAIAPQDGAQPQR